MIYMKELTKGGHKYQILNSVLWDKDITTTRNIYTEYNG
jgi:hypothetical protein